MKVSELAAKLQEAKADLAFALAQGDGYAEDAAAARIVALAELIAASSVETCESLGRHICGPVAS